MAVNPTAIQTASARRSGEGAMPLSWNAPTPGNLLYAVCSVRSGGATVGFSLPGFTLIQSRESGITVPYSVWAKAADGTETNLTMTVSGAGTVNTTWSVSEFQGADAAGPIIGNFDENQAGSSGPCDAVANSGGLALATFAGFAWNEMAPATYSDAYVQQAESHPPNAGSAGTLVASKAVEAGSTACTATFATPTTSHSRGIIVFAEGGDAPTIGNVTPAQPAEQQAGVTVTVQNDGGAQGTLSYAGLAVNVTGYQPGNPATYTVNWPQVATDGSTVGFNVNHPLVFTAAGGGNSAPFQVQTAPVPGYRYFQTAINDSGAAGIFDDDTLELGVDFCYGSEVPQDGLWDFSDAARGIINGVPSGGQFIYRLWDVSDGVWSNRATETFQVGDQGESITGTVPVEPEEGATGVLIQGFGFGAQPGTVTYRGQLLSVSSWSDTEIVVNWPSVTTGSGLELNRLHALQVNQIAAFGVTTVPKAAYEYVTITANTGIFQDDIIFANDICYGRQTVGDGMDYTRLSEGLIDAVPNGGEFRYRLWDAARKRWTREVDTKFTVI